MRQKYKICFNTFYLGGGLWPEKIEKVRMTINFINPL